MPIQVVGLQNIVAVDAGAARNLALDADGTVWAWKADDHPTPTQVEGLGPAAIMGGGGPWSGIMGTEGNLALQADGAVWTWKQYGRQRQAPAPVAGTPTP